MSDTVRLNWLQRISLANLGMIIPTCAAVSYFYPNALPCVLIGAATWALIFWLAGYIEVSE